jgi:uncharacterized OB-fold protein
VSGQGPEAAAVELPASRDGVTGELYVPPRRFAADGSLRECVVTTVPARGRLVSWTEFRSEFYGLIDLSAGARIQALLGAGPHALGAEYVGVADRDGKVRFAHE